jgi:thioredoxin-dependent peroxiredoxin
MIQAGTIAPDFNEKDQQGNTVSLSAFKGKKVVLYFYPKDDTPGCTAEACSFRDNYDSLTEKGFVVIGVSPDNEKKHAKFVEKYSLPFTLVADTEKNIANAYGVWGKKKFMGKEYEGVFRTTFVIDENGIISHVIDKVDTKDSTAQLLEVTGL